jgi:hypothetical protein
VRCTQLDAGNDRRLGTQRQRVRPPKRGSERAAHAICRRRFTRDDVRALSPDQQAYYIKVYNITPAQQDHIRCLPQSPASLDASSRKVIMPLW